MNEVFQQTILSGSNLLNDPWEITYGPDGFLWITEAKGYKVYRMNPSSGTKTTILDISPSGSGYLTSAEHAIYNRGTWPADGTRPWPQGGLMGLAIHPDFNAPTPKKYIYLGYVHHAGNLNTNGSGQFYTNYLVRFTYNSSTDKLESPVVVCDTIPGSKDHNSGRLIIAKENGVAYLYYAEGDMGSGQFENLTRLQKAQLTHSYEGKILRFNLEPESNAIDAGSASDKWIPSGVDPNPFNATLGVQSAVWAKGMRNNQGFAYDPVNDILYGSSHGPFSDDEINILAAGKNYGHPLVIGKSSDGNYNNAKAGPSGGSCPFINSESANATAIGSSYKDPLYSFYPVDAGDNATPSSIQFIYNNQSYTAPYSPTGSAQNKNQHWLSEAPSGMDVYTGSFIPGWKNSLLLAALKWGRLMRLKLNTTGSAVVSTNGQDTISYFDSDNRYRDLAFSPDGKDIFVIMDKSSASSGPSQNNLSIVSCPGCVHKYTFLGYLNDDVTNKSTMPDAIDITTTTNNVVTSGTTTTIDASNSMLWVPITGPDGNIMAEIKANGNNLGTITSSFYTSGTVRENASRRLYLNRSITINPQTSPSTPVSIRFYITGTEFTALKNATSSQNMPSGVSGIGDIKILKNNDVTPTAMTAATSTINPIYAEAHGSDFVVQADISSFSTFYFGNPSMSVLPLELLNFKGSLKNNVTVLQWETSNEINTSHFVVERSVDGNYFQQVGSVDAKGNANDKNNYSYTDHDAAKQSAPLIYYRLKMLDADNEFKYSNVINVLFKASSTINVYPNPINEELNLRISVAKADKVQIVITDMQGRVVYRQVKSVSAGVNDLQINTKIWPSQSYSLKVSGSDKKVLVTKKIIKR